MEYRTRLSFLTLNKPAGECARGFARPKFSQVRLSDLAVLRRYGFDQHRAFGNPAAALLHTHHVADLAPPSSPHRTTAWPGLHRRENRQLFGLQPCPGHVRPDHSLVVLYRSSLLFPRLTPSVLPCLELRRPYPIAREVTIMESQMGGIC